MITIKTKSEVKVKVTVTRKWYVSLPSQDASTHQIWNSYLKEYRRYAPDTKRDGRTDSAITICLPKFLWGHKNSSEQEKESIIRVRVGSKNPSLEITTCHQSAILVMPNGDPLDGLFYPTLTLLIDSYLSLFLKCFRPQYISKI